MSIFDLEKSGVKYLYHYYEKDKGPFLNLSTLDMAEAESILDGIRKEGNVFAAQRQKGYLKRRRELEAKAREIFISKGGKPVSQAPHYMVVEECGWFDSWYKECACVKIPISDIDPKHVSFSYGDLFPTFSDSVKDGREYRKQVYTFDEIKLLIKKYGLPQKWNVDGKCGPERYIEAHVWSDDVTEKC